MKTKGIVIVLASVLFTSCSDVLIEDNIARTWELKAYLRNVVEETGKFVINEDDMSIHISDVSSIADFSDHHSTLSSSIIHVENINVTEFVYSFENGGDNHEFRFIKKE